MNRQILFLCSGNYYRSRFAEIFFNYLADKVDLEWRAESRGIVAQWSRNPGPISQEALRGLAARGISHNAPRYPLQLTENDLTQAERIVALYEDEHRPMMDAYFPEWTTRVEYWHVPDLGEMRADEALAIIERNMKILVWNLSQPQEEKGSNKMTRLLQQAIAHMQELPDEEQDTIATIIFEELDDEEEWDRAFAASQDKLAKWANKVRADIQAGRFKEMGWDEI